MCNREGLKQVVKRAETINQTFKEVNQLCFFILSGARQLHMFSLPAAVEI